MPRGCVISDLHYLSRRSVFARHQALFERAIKDSNVVVLNGDIFDFRWSRSATPEAAIADAIDWLEKLMSLNSDAQFHYIGGNHDSAPDFVDAVLGLAGATQRITWHPHLWQIGGNLFLHGDIIHCGSIAELERYREQFHQESKLLQRFDPLYQLLHHMRVPQLVSRLNSPQRMLEMLEVLLDSGVIPVQSPVTDIYFGHSHHPFEALERNGRRYHNTGAVVNGMQWRILRFQLTERA